MKAIFEKLAGLFKKTEQKIEDSKNFEEFKSDDHAPKIDHVQTTVQQEREVAEKNESKELNKSFIEMSDRFISVMKEKFEISLGYKVADLEKLDSFINENEKFFEKELKAEKKKLLPLMYAYVGEVIRRSKNGSWKKPSAKQSAIEIVVDDETSLIYPGTIIKQRIEKKTPLMAAVNN